jgi:hypothetical protein
MNHRFNSILFVDYVKVFCSYLAAFNIYGKIRAK